MQDLKFAAEAISKIAESAIQNIVKLYQLSETSEGWPSDVSKEPNVLKEVEENETISEKTKIHEITQTTSLPILEDARFERFELSEPKVETSKPQQVYNFNFAAPQRDVKIDETLHNLNL